MQAALEFRKADIGITDPLDISDVERLMALISTDPDMALAKSRTILERFITTLFQARVGSPGTRPLEGLIREAGKADVLPRKVQALCEVVRELGNVGAHPILDDEKATHREAQLATMALLLIFEWYSREGTPEQRRACVRSRVIAYLRAFVDLSQCSVGGETNQQLREVIADCIDQDEMKLTQPEREGLVDDVLRELALAPGERSGKEFDAPCPTRLARAYRACAGANHSEPRWRLSWEGWFSVGVLLWILAGLVGYWMLRP